jgi:hypothetical protein
MPARRGRNHARDRTGGKKSKLHGAAMRSSEPPMPWGLAVGAIVIILVIIGWGWGISNGGGWGHRHQIARIMAPASGPTDGPATRAWTSPSNGQFR